MRPVYVLECERRSVHVARQEPALGIFSLDPWREAIRHHEVTGHGVKVYRCEEDRDELTLAMAQVPA